MDAHELVWLDDEVTGAAVRQVGGTADRTVVEQVAHEAATERWLTRPRVANDTTVLAPREVREALETRSAPDDLIGLCVGEAR